MLPGTVGRSRLLGRRGSRKRPHGRVQLRVGADSSRNKRRGDTRRATYNRGPFDIATLAIFPEYLEFEGQEVLRLVVEGSAGRTAK
jgi:hypothetical protein